MREIHIYMKEPSKTVDYKLACIAHIRAVSGLGLREALGLYKAVLEGKIMPLPLQATPWHWPLRGGSVESVLLKMGYSRSLGILPDQLQTSFEVVGFEVIFDYIPLTRTQMLLEKGL